MFERTQNFKRSANHSIFLWGARQTGKSTLIKKEFEDALVFDLLQSDTFTSLIKSPHLLREIVKASPDRKIIVIDEIQKIPILLNEVQWLIENEKRRFILSGSSPRKIIRSHHNLLGGRALRYELFPLSFSEIPNFHLSKALNNGLLPNHYLSDDVELLLSSYIKSYLEEEIYAEARIRNLNLFSNFLYNAAFSNGEIVNYANIASECGISSPTVKEYFQILEDTMIGKYMYSYRKRPKRQVVVSPKFYFFDVGIVNHLLKRRFIELGTENYGYAFEHFIYMELNAHAHYTQKNYPITFWRTSTKMEVDFILGEAEVAIEVKSAIQVQPKHLKNIKSFMEEYPVKHSIIVCHEKFPRLVNNILILPVEVFLQRLWAGDFI